MPLPRYDYIPIPAAIPRRVVDTRTLGELLRRQGEDTMQLELSRGNNAAAMWAVLGRAFSNYAQGRREDQEAKNAAEVRRQEKEAADKLKRDELAERAAERKEAERIRKEAEERQRRMDAEKRGDAVAESVGYGPINEAQLDQVLESPAQAARARYSFGPGTAEGPELLPTKDQQALIDWKQEVEAKGGMVSPNGQAVMPPAPRAEPNPTEASLALMAANGDKGAQRALEILARQKAAERAPKEPKAPAKLPAAMAQTVAAAKTSLSGLDMLEKLFKPEFVGPARGRYNATERSSVELPIVGLPDAPEGFEDFAAETAALKNRVIQAITGAAVGVQEQGRIMGEIPDYTDPPSKWKAKARATRRNLQQLVANQIQMGTGAQGPLEDGTVVEVNAPGVIPGQNPFRK
jgi:hypothetical protein